MHVPQVASLFLQFAEGTRVLRILPEEIAAHGSLNPTSLSPSSQPHADTVLACLFHHAARRRALPVVEHVEAESDGEASGLPAFGHAVFQPG